MNKRYENKSAYDPGRFRYPITFLQENITIAPDGSQIVDYTQLISTKAVRLAVTRRFTLLGDMSVEAGESLMYNYWYFIIRLRSDFQPKKDMLLSAPDGIYTINAAPQLDEPGHYWRMLCVKTDTPITT